MIGTELKSEVVRVAIIIAARELAHDLLGFAVKEADAKIDRCVVVSNANLRPLARIFSFDRIALREVPLHRSLHPGGVVQISIDNDFLGRSDGVECMSRLRPYTLRV